jgi:hypothetical protein
MSLIRHPSGEYKVTSLEAGYTIDEGQTLSCVHCGQMWHVKPGSGHRRGWCFRCNGPTCGSRECQECRPWERQMEIIERREHLRREALAALRS